MAQCVHNQETTIKKESVRQTFSSDLNLNLIVFKYIESVNIYDSEDRFIQIKMWLTLRKVDLKAITNLLIFGDEIVNDSRFLRSD